MRYGLIVVIVSFVQLSFAQSNFEGLGVGIRPELGTIIPHRVLMKHLVQGHTRGVNLELLYQTTGKKEWQSVYNYPKIGGILYFTDFGYSEVLGQAIGGYSVIMLPFFRKNNFSFNSRLGVGLAYHTKTFDQEVNPKNNVISSAMNSLIVLGVELEHRMEKGALTMSSNLTHFSNGASKMPNLGINTAVFSLGYTYFFNEFIPKDELIKKEYVKQPVSAYLMGIGSLREVYPTGGRKYPIGSFSFIAQKQLRPKLGAEIIADVFYNASNRVMVEHANASHWETVQLGLYAGAFLPINKVDLLVGMGCYLKNDFNLYGLFYHRFGMRYHISNRWMANLTIKAHWGRADYFEYGIAYKLF